MQKCNIPIRLSGHAKSQLSARGTTEKEVIETIKTSEWIPVELNRFEARKNFDFFNQIWNKKPYNTKQVRPIFVEEPDEIVVITVYVYYF